MNKAPQRTKSIWDFRIVNEEKVNYHLKAINKFPEVFHRSNYKNSKVLIEIKKSYNMAT